MGRRDRISLAAHLRKEGSRHHQGCWAISGFGKAQLAEAETLVPCGPGWSAASLHTVVVTTRSGDVSHLQPAAGIPFLLPLCPELALEQV